MRSDKFTSTNIHIVLIKGQGAVYRGNGTAFFIQEVHVE